MAVSSRPAGLLGIGYFDLSGGFEEDLGFLVVFGDGAGDFDGVMGEVL